MSTKRPRHRFHEVVGCQVGTNNDYAPQVQQAATALVYDLQLLDREASPADLKQKIREAAIPPNGDRSGLEKLAAEFIRARGEGGSKKLVGLGLESRADIEGVLGPAIALLTTLIERVEAGELEAARVERATWIVEESKKT